MSLTITEWKSELLQYIKSGKASDALMSWIAESALYNYESDDFLEADVFDELALMEKKSIERKTADDLSTEEGCNAAIAHREALLGEMVGSLYPPIVRQEIDAIVKLRDELLRQERERNL